MTQIQERLLRTKAAADFLTAHGKQTSVSLLRKLRLKGESDPGSKGPSWVRAPNGDCLYPVSALELYLSEYYAQLKPMGAGKAPEAALEARRSR